MSSCGFTGKKNGSETVGCRALDVFFLSVLLLNYECKPYAEKVIRVGQVTAEFVCNRITVDRDTIRVFRRIAVFD
ncbi:hypothetical protein GHT06_020803 [Daphnia sinensis]|uniref:Uncharacterized protein n=1 Tax=Daphnia sinensis TaxID=1820382 RepID=A0AAD5KIC1_9CRUS|nr:hypothetical protein GHT06_020803 [Daphnia sinensis]